MTSWSDSNAKLLESLSRGDLNAAGRLLREDFLITTAGWIAEPVGKQAWLVDWRAA